VNPMYLRRLLPPHVGASTRGTDELSQVNKKSKAIGSISFVLLELWVLSSAWTQMARRNKDAHGMQVSRNRASGRTAVEAFGHNAALLPNND
jgi:hypothetical protein